MRIYDEAVKRIVNNPGYALFEYGETGHVESLSPKITDSTKRDTRADLLRFEESDIVTTAVVEGRSSLGPNDHGYPLCIS